MTAFRLAAAVFFLLAARTAQACPACTTRGSGGYFVPLLLGAMILTPYVITMVVLRIVRRAEAERRREEATDGPGPSSQGGALDSGAPAKA